MPYRKTSKLVIDTCYKCSTTRVIPVVGTKVNDCTKCGTSKFIWRRELQRKLNIEAKIQTEPSLIVDVQGRIKEEKVPKKTSKLKGVSATETDLEDKCTICLCNFKIEDQLYKTSCSHKFHTDCLGTWLNMKKTCPQCTSSVEPETTADNKKQLAKVNEEKPVFKPVSPVLCPRTRNKSQ